jgi:hypothetical protein
MRIEDMPTMPLPFEGAAKLSLLTISVMRESNLINDPIYLVNDCETCKALRIKGKNKFLLVPEDFTLPDVVNKALVSSYIVNVFIGIVERGQLSNIVYLALPLPTPPKTGDDARAQKIRAGYIQTQASMLALLQGRDNGMLTFIPEDGVLLAKPPSKRLLDFIEPLPDESVMPHKERIATLSLKRKNGILKAAEYDGIFAPDVLCRAYREWEER